MGSNDAHAPKAIDDKALLSYYNDIKAYEKLQVAKGKEDMKWAHEDRNGNVVIDEAAGKRAAEMQQKLSELKQKLSNEGHAIQAGQYQGKNGELFDKAVKDVDKVFDRIGELDQKGMPMVKEGQNRGQNMVVVTDSAGTRTEGMYGTAVPEMPTLNRNEQNALARGAATQAVETQGQARPQAQHAR